MINQTCKKCGCFLSNSKIHVCIKNEYCKDCGQFLGKELHKCLPVSIETRKKISISLIGNKHTLGHKLTEKHKQKIKEFMQKMRLTEEHKQRIGLANKKNKRPDVSEYNRKYKIEQIEDKNPNWQGGKSFEPYGLEFNKKLKEQVRLRDRYRCQECFRHQSELKQKLNIHHIDYNKQNNNPNNLISLCKNCHTQTNFNRENWTEYYKDAMIKNGNC